MIKYSLNKAQLKNMTNKLIRQNTINVILIVLASFTSLVCLYLFIRYMISHNKEALYRVIRSLILCVTEFTLYFVIKYRALNRNLKMFDKQQIDGVVNYTIEFPDENTIRVSTERGDIVVKKVENIVRLMDLKENFVVVFKDNPAVYVVKNYDTMKLYEWVKRYLKKRNIKQNEA